MKFYIAIFLSLCFITPSKGQSPEELFSYLPEVQGWTLEKYYEVFDPDNLFDRINGSAPLYIENNFREMTSLEYTRGEDYITIQAYRHASPEDAFGMYASERTDGIDFLPIGGEAQGDGKNIFFFAGNIYVRMWGNSKEDISSYLCDIAGTLAAKIDPNADYPPVSRAFPRENKIPYSESYTTSNYLGHEFLKKVYTADYIKDGNKYQLFAIDAANKDDAGEILKKYLTFTKQEEDVSDGLIIIRDRYNGNIPIMLNGKFIIGIYSPDGAVEDNESILSDFLKEIIAL